MPRNSILTHQRIPNACKHLNDYIPLLIKSYPNVSILSHYNYHGSISNLGVEPRLYISAGTILLHAMSGGYTIQNYPSLSILSHRNCPGSTDFKVGCWGADTYTYQLLQHCSMPRAKGDAIENVVLLGLLLGREKGLRMHMQVKPINTLQLKIFV